MTNATAAAERSPADAVRRVEGTVNYTAPMRERPRYYANDHSRDVLVLEPHRVTIEDARTRADPPRLARDGFQLVPHRSAVRDFRDGEEVMRVHRAEIERLIMQVSGADRAVVRGGGLLRFGERSPDSGRLNNSLPARFIHVDISDTPARGMAEQSRPADVDRPIRRFAHYNVWRVISPPPQDVPLAICEPLSVDREDLVPADAVFDAPGQPEWSFEGWVVRHNLRHRWTYFSDMHKDDALMFITNDSDPAAPHCAPHSAFDDPSCPPDAVPRTSIEMRGVAYWFA